VTELAGMARHAPEALLPLAAPVLILIASLSVVLLRTRTVAAPVLTLALFAEVAHALASHALNANAGGDELVLFTWSPLGLYGVAFALRRGADAALLTIPPLLLAIAGIALAERRRLWFSAYKKESLSGLAGSAGALLALAACTWATRAADLVSLYFAVCTFLVATAILLWAGAGQAQAGRRLLVTYIVAVAALGSVLVLGKVNGQFQLSGLSTAGFGGGVFFGVALTAMVAAGAFPFHGWLVRLGRNPLTPAAGAAGVALALTLLLVTQRTIELQDQWQGWLRLAGWAAALGGGVTALTRRRPAVALAAVFTAKAGVIFLAASIATPAAMAAVLLYELVTLPALGFLWLTAAVPWGGHLRTRGPGGTATSPLRTPGFWLNALLLGIAAGLPPTLGGVARSALTTSVTSWPTGDQLIRVPLFIGDLAVLVAGGALVWNPRYLPPVRGGAGWTLCLIAAIAMCGPLIAPGAIIESWLRPAAGAAVGMAGAPMTLEAARIPTLPSAFLMVVTFWVLWQRVRGREWLPGPARAVVGVVALGWMALGRRWRTRGISRWPGLLADHAWVWFEGTAVRVVLILRLVEERYYAGAAVLLAVAMIYIVGR